MKRFAKVSAVLAAMVLALASFTACSDDDDDDEETFSAVTSLDQLVGTWSGNISMTVSDDDTGNGIKTIFNWKGPVEYEVTKSASGTSYIAKTTAKTGTEINIKVTCENALDAAAKAQLDADIGEALEIDDFSFDASADNKVFTYTGVLTEDSVIEEPDTIGNKALTLKTIDNKSLPAYKICGNKLQVYELNDAETAAELMCTLTKK